MFNGTLANAAGIQKLTIGVTDAQGKRAEMKFVAPGYSPANTTAPLVAVEAINTGAGVEGSDANAPTEDELNRQYLAVNDWNPHDTPDLGVLWDDPLTGGEYTFRAALQLQFCRDLNERARQDKDICQDDYEYATGTGRYANGETPLGDEMYGGD